MAGGSAANGIVRHASRCQSVRRSCRHRRTGWTPSERPPARGARNLRQPRAGVSILRCRPCIARRKAIDRLGRGSASNDDGQPDVVMAGCGTIDRLGRGSDAGWGRLPRGLDGRPLRAGFEARSPTRFSNPAGRGNGRWSCADDPGQRVLSASGGAWPFQCERASIARRFALCACHGSGATNRGGYLGTRRDLRSGSCDRDALGHRGVVSSRLGPQG